MANNFKIFTWDETTGNADFYLQGDLILSLNLPTYMEAESIHKALNKTYKQGADDGLTWIANNIEENRNRI